jgi:hypothetical protein
MYALGVIYFRPYKNKEDMFMKILNQLGFLILHICVFIMSLEENN